MRFRPKPWMIMGAVLLLLVVAFFGTFYIAAPKRDTTAEGIAGSVAAPAVTGLSGFAISVRDFFDRLFGIRDVDKEYEELKIRVQKLEVENQLMQDLMLENERLMELLKYKEKYPNYEYLPARVIGKDMGNWFFSFTLNRGSEDGVEKEMMVVNELGLVGTVIEVFPRSCKVMAIIDRSSAISVVVERSRDNGMAHGSGDPQSGSPTCSVWYLTANSEVVPGDKVVTADFDTITIKGIPVGEISSVPRDRTKETVVELLPYVDFAHVENVLIVKREKAPEAGETAEPGSTAEPDGTASPGGTASPDGTTPPESGQTADPEAGQTTSPDQEEGN